jgi:hypothetical protein
MSGGDMPGKRLSAEDLLALYFDAQFCEAQEKVAKEQAWLNELERAVQQTGKPLYALKLALLKVYPRYRAKRLGKEMPDLPFEVRDK